MITYESIIDCLSEYGDVQSSVVMNKANNFPINLHNVTVSLERFREFISGIHVSVCTKSWTEGICNNLTLDMLKIKQAVPLECEHKNTDVFLLVDFCKNSLFENLALSTTAKLCEISKVKIPIEQIPSENFLDGSLHLYKFNQDKYVSGNIVVTFKTQ